MADLGAEGDLRLGRNCGGIVVQDGTSREESSVGGASRPDERAQNLGAARISSKFH